MTHRNRPLPLLLACLTALALPACTTSPEAGHPNTTPASSSTATGSQSNPGTATPPPTAGPTAPPTRPPAASGSSLAAGEAFLGYYIELLNYAYSTGESAPFLAESDKGCVGCNAIAEYVQKSNATNGGLQGDFKDQLVDVKEIYRGESGKLGGSASVRTGAYQERPTPGAALVPQPASTGTMEFTLSADEGNWVMFEMQINE